MNANYKDSERVACLKKDWDELSPADQALLLAERAKETATDIKTDWKGWLLKLGKWLLLALAGIVAGTATALMTSCTVTPAQNAQIQAADAAFHKAYPYFIIVDGK